MENENIDNESLNRQLAEAEKRGYQRGLNEQIASKMREPAMWESTVATPPESQQPREFEILAGVGKSIWDCQD